MSGIGRRTAALLAVVVLFAAGCGGGSKPAGSGDRANATPTTPKQAEGSPKKGGVLKVAIIGEPPSLDSQWTTANVTQNIGFNVYEALFSLDEKSAPQPMLAESFKEEEGGKRFSITLRKGVKFHNDKELTTDDVIASLQRWMKLSGYGKTLSRALDSITASDKYTLVIQLKEPLAIVPVLLASPQQQSVIYPKEVVQEAGDGQIKQFIGTGPYKVAEWVPNRYVRLVRFDGYAARSEAPSLQAGKKSAYLDEIQFIPVGEPQVRIQGVQTGEYQYAEEVPQDLYDSLKDDPNMTPVVVKPWWYPIMVFNKKQGLFTNVKARQAVQAATDFAPMMATAFGNKDFYRLTNSLFPEESRWFTEEAKELYGRKDPETARKLLQEAGYKGETIRILTTKQYDWMYKLAVAMKPQLEAAGMKVQLDVVDWATLIDRRNKPDQYEIFTTAIGQSVDPAVVSNWDAGWPGWWVNPEKDTLLKQLAQETDYQKRLDLQSKFQRLWYTDVPMLKTGDFFLFALRSKKLRGPIGSPYPYFFNNWLE
jgi:peptide/nickel transport system substrate-binding protein